MTRWCPQRTLIPQATWASIDSLSMSGRKALGRGAARAATKGIQVERAQVQGRLRAVSDVILDEARRWHADLLVMGTHGRRGVKRLLLGSDAERVLREAPVPVLLVRAAEPGRRGRKRAFSAKRRQKSHA
jgi:nucleotide-binding universal stress UspA family protein